MKTDSSTVIMFAQKYSILFIVIIISICTGYISYEVATGNNMSWNVGNYAMGEIDNELIEVTFEDILDSNVVTKEIIEVQKEEIPFSIVSIGNERSGKSTVISEGKNGIKEVVLKTMYENNEIKEQNEIANAITMQPASKVVSYGTKATTTSRGTVIYRTDETSDIPVESYTKVIKMRYTAYCLCKKCCGKSPDHPAYGVTASGYKITPGINEKIVAVDPTVIKLGSTVYVQNLSGKADYGYALAADTGGAIKQNRIDLYIDSHQEALKVGTGYCYVYVLD